MKKNLYKTPLFVFLFLISSFGFSQLPLDPQGWTILTPSSDSRFVFVSNSTGSDANDGLTITTPKKTIAAGLSLLRDGFPDYLLLKKGDVWYESFGVFNKGGRGPTEPIVIASYDPTGNPCLPRPLIKSGDNGGFVTQGGMSTKRDNIVLMGIHFYANKRDPKSPEYDPAAPSTVGLSIRKPAENLLIEDCVVEFYKDNIQVQSVPANGAIKNFKLRRSVCADAYSSGGAHAQGIYMDKVHDILLEENLFDHNGWHDTIAGAEPTIFNHNFYIQYSDSAKHCKNIIVRGNIIARASSHGLQLRPGGTIDNNLYLQNALAMFNGRYFPAYTTNNVVLDARDVAANMPRGMGIEVKRNANGLIANNIVAHKTNPNVGARYAYEMRYSGDGGEVAKSHITFKNNIAYNWNGPSLDVTNIPTLNDTTIIEGNEFQNFSSSYMINHFGSAIIPGFKYQGNTYHGNRTASQWFRVGTTNYNVAGWQTVSGETGLVAKQISYVDPNRTIATYQNSMGEVATLEAFLLEARKQSKCNWRTEYTAAAVNNYIRKGFCKTNELPVAEYNYTINGNNVVFSDRSTNSDSNTWDFGDGNISKSNSPLHTYSTPGTYSITLTTTNKCATHTKVQAITIVSTVGMDAATFNKDRILVYPNPTEENFVVDVSNVIGYTESDRIKISITNVLGQEIKTIRSTIGNNEAKHIDVSDCDTGIYNLLINIGEEFFLKTLIIK